ncbi:archaeal proteasome endopeptidase complex subunit beta [Candidatus Micrarchaeota archaeon]|nr:archaeal proteasome endopeptidase complex subunit beta [Candidatus Micrarchaeota archaeon]
MSDESMKVLKGTTTVSLSFNGGIVIAADKRATYGTFIAAKEVEKVHMIDDKMAMSIAGGVGDAQSLLRFIKAEIELYKYTNGQNMPVQGAATLLANILQGNKYFPYLVQLIVAGVDDKPRIYDLDPFGGLIEEKYVSTGSGSVVAYGILDEFYKDNLGENDAIRIAAKAVAAAMRRDSATGEGIDLILITQDKVKRLTKDQLQTFLNG